MSKQYPYIQSQQTIDEFFCDHCKKDSRNGVLLEWRVDWFQSNCETEKLCIPCHTKQLAKMMEDEKERQAKAMEKMEKQNVFWKKMKTRLEMYYKVEYLTEYQWRINGEVDIYTQSRRYHDIVKNERGSYQDMFHFLREYFYDKE